MLHEVCFYKVLLQFFKNKLEKTCQWGYLIIRLMKTHCRCPNITLTCWFQTIINKSSKFWNDKTWWVVLFNDQLHHSSVRLHWRRGVVYLNWSKHCDMSLIWYDCDVYIILTIRQQVWVVCGQIVNEAHPSWVSLIDNDCDFSNCFNSAEGRICIM